jgi:hypothetical protein
MRWDTIHLDYYSSAVRMVRRRTLSANHISLIGAATENPSFEIIAALLSRSGAHALRALEQYIAVKSRHRKANSREAGRDTKAAGSRGSRAGMNSGTIGVRRWRSLPVSLAQALNFFLGTSDTTL